MQKGVGEGAEESAKRFQQRSQEESIVMRKRLAALVMIGVIGVAVIHAHQEPKCLGAADVARFVKERVLPHWVELTPEALRKEWPGTLRETAHGPSSTWAEVHDRCAVYFVFAPTPPIGTLQLRGVRIIEEGNRNDIERARIPLTAAFGADLTSTEERDLRKHHSVTTSWRIPPALDVAGVRFIRTLNVTVNPRKQASERTLWQLEVMCDRLTDQPIGRHP
jgi:hypothetical protein